MEIPVELPLDSDGYLRRQCPRCERVFKWHHDEPTSDSEKHDGYFCPYCSEWAPSDQWWTDEQVEYIEAVAADEAMKQIEIELRPSVEQLNRAGGGLIRMEMQVPRRVPPPPLVEQDDMTAVEPPCHPAEPIKIQPDWSDAVTCLICAQRFTI